MLDLRPVDFDVVTKDKKVSQNCSICVSGMRKTKSRKISKKILRKSMTNPYGMKRVSKMAGLRSMRISELKRVMS
jgi:hypothetical protein